MPDYKRKGLGAKLRHWKAKRIGSKLAKLQKGGSENLNDPKQQKLYQRYHKLTER
tara:strand:- start:86 stop:250 length:165 start_codon:yes stop_codon:yes gene_type:complete